MSIFKPARVYEGVSSISFDDLDSLNIKGIILDIDNTLIDMYKNIPESIKEWVNKAKEKGYKLIVLSNTNRRHKIELIKEVFGVTCLTFAMKPFKRGFLKACKELELNPNEVCMVGDQLFTDVIGANRANVVPIYVKPINKKEYWYTAWKRNIERSILKHYGY
ncbi:MAG: YqeG family HAD IIIA-type phosphatase [Clostridia bacterium]|nr:YqeG family HAD IIIA-type phosphatase [Clostridia bacterium]